MSMSKLLSGVKMMLNKALVLGFAVITYGMFLKWNLYPDGEGKALPIRTTSRQCDRRIEWPELSRHALETKGWLILSEWLMIVEMPAGYNSFPAGHFHLTENTQNENY